MDVTRKTKKRKNDKSNEQEKPSEGLIGKREAQSKKSVEKSSSNMHTYLDYDVD